jgi:hypothetical protein
MPRQKSGKPVGRPPVYSSEDDRPVTVSLRIPHDLAEQTKRYASLRRQSVTELLLDGLRWRIGEGDPRSVGTALPPQSPHSEQYYGNTETSHGVPTDTALLEEIRAVLACQATQLHEIAQAITQHASVPAHHQYLSNTVIEDEQTDKSADTAQPVLALAGDENRQTENGAASQPETAEQHSDDNRQPGNVPALEAGSADESMQTPQERRRALVLETLPHDGAGMTPVAIRAKTGLSKTDVTNDLRELLERGDVVKPSKGHYVRLQAKLGAAQ